MSKLTIGCSPLTGDIFAGRLLKCGTMWASGKQEVTKEAVLSVAQHLLIKEEKVKFSYKDEKYELKVTKVKPTTK